MFTTAAAGAANTRGKPRFGKRDQACTGTTPACAGLPETMGELPVVALAEEIDTPGRGPDPRADHDRRQPGRCRRPTAAASTPRSSRLEFMVSVDIYVNETTRHADVILPAPSALQKEPLRPRAAVSSRCATWPTTARRSSRSSDGPARRVGGARPPGAGAPGHGRRRRPRHRRRPHGRRSLLQRAVRGRDQPDPRPRRRRAARAARRPRAGPERILDFMLRTGPYGEGFGVDPGGLTLDVLHRQPARHRLRRARAPPARRAAHARRDDRPGARAARRRRRPPARRARRPARPPLRARRPAAPALEQLLDAQRERAREGQAPLHAAPAPRRRRRARAGRRRPGARARPGSGRWSCRSRSPTPSGPGW